jgi:1-acyl-sn-glycerol-3-phosphate acyltransferase
MAGQNRGIGVVPRVLHLLFMLLWTAVSVLMYGICCILAGIFSKKLPQVIGRAWDRHLLWLAGVKVEVQGGEKLAPEACYVFFSNHQSALDIPILYTGLHHSIVFIAKKELFWIPIMGWGMHSMGHIVMDRSSARKARSALTKAVGRLKKNSLSLVLFPEGTRSTDGTLGEFKQGSFALALDAGVPIVPLIIEGAHERLPKNSFAVRPGKVKLTIGDQIDPSGMEKGELAAKVRKAIQDVMERPKGRG